ncbi:MAG: zinc ribbon domain-containing protein [Longimicrobiales bacterium]|nr:zinc ribbon domain-containing protein [Longimicrobiales bacterium]
MGDQFREAEDTFALLREKFNDRRISQKEFVDSLKQLRIKDDEGRFWVIGAQSGKWYAFEGGEWVEAKPPSQMERKAICIACGFENDLEAEFCARCGNRGEDEASEKPAASDAAGLSAARPQAGGEVVIRSFHPVSFFWFFAVLGMFAGILLGLLAGVTNLFTGFVAGLPGFFVDHQGDLLGGLDFSILGGIAGFGIGGAAGAAAAVVSNGILSLVGGVRIRRS